MQTEMRSEKIRVETTEQKQAVQDKVAINQVQQSIPTRGPYLWYLYR